MTQEKKIFQSITSKGVYRVYELLYSKNLVSFVLTDESRGKIDALVANVDGSYFGKDIYETAELKATAYLYFIIKNHPLIDGNKRTAVLVFEVVCELNNLNPNYKDFNLDAIAVFIEKIQEKDHQLVIDKLSKAIFEMH